MIVIAAALAYGLIEVDAHSSWELQKKFPRFFGVSADGSRTILSVIASSAIAVAGVTFSITIVSLSLAASQYTPRVLRNFMRDRSNQIVLGTLVSIFIYCLIVLRTVKGGEEPFVPAVSIVTAIVLAIGGIVAFIYFIHHVATGIQASTILSAVAAETVTSIRRLFPDELGHGREESENDQEHEKLLHDRHWEPVLVTTSGYIQSVETSALMKFACEHECTLKLEHCIGDFVCKGTPLVSILDWDRIHKAHIRSLNQLFGISSYRSIEQDPAFGIRQMVDIALKALSPGINDTTTAKTCIDYLGTVLQPLISREIPSPFRFRDGKLRLIAYGPTFESLVNQMFNEIRQNSAGNVSVIIRALNTIQKAGESCASPLRRGVLGQQLLLLASQAEASVKIDADLGVIQAHLQQAAQALHQILPSHTQPQLSRRSA